MAADILLILMRDAAVEDGSMRLLDGSQLPIQRGQAFRSTERLADRLRSNKASVQRAITKLKEHGYLSTAVESRALKRGWGSSPSVVNVHVFDQLSGPTRPISRPTETGLGTIEGNHLGEEVLEPLSEWKPKSRDLTADANAYYDLPQEMRDVAAGIKSADDLLKLYHDFINTIGDAREGLIAAESAGDKHGFERATGAVLRLQRKGGGTMSAKWFFSDQILPAYM